jgi:hypothetical protein
MLNLGRLALHCCLFISSSSEIALLSGIVSLSPYIHGYLDREADTLTKTWAMLEMVH